MFEIKKITHEEAKALLASCENGKFKPEGLFYIEGNFEGRKFYVAYDNSTGDCWCEAFDELGECESWLKGEFEVNDD